MKHLILGTAGHIDHGKTSLVKALTGTDTDRLPEEKKRGITIDLGFANLVIGDNSFGIVDVPGHEDLIRNMLAGATGMDAVMLVVAADEGVMPQTREHVAILDQLGVSKGVVALTKCDIADPDWIDLVSDDVRQLLAPTTLADIPVTRVSSTTGTGLDELKAHLSTLYALRTTPDAEVFRLPIDRVFVVHGTGTVVTGTVWSGTLQRDANVELQPSGKTARVRTLQSHAVETDSIGPGARVAIALSGVSKDEVTRGDVLVEPKLWEPTLMITVKWRAVSESDWSIEPRQRVRVHLGTAEVLARVAILDEEWLQLRLEAPLHARIGDRVVIRSYSPLETIGGGIVASLDKTKRAQLTDEERKALLEALDGNVSASVLLEGVNGVDETTLRTIPGSLKSPVITIGNRVFSDDVARKVVSNVIRTMDDLHALHPLRPSIGRAELREQAAYAHPLLLDWAIDEAIRQGDLASDGSAIRRQGFEPRLTERQKEGRDRILTAIRAGGLAPPMVGEADWGKPEEVRQLLKLLESEGQILAVSPDLYIARDAFETAVTGIVERFGGSEPLSASAFKEVLGVSRKHLIPILEYMDRRGITFRAGDVRTVQPSVK